MKTEHSGLLQLHNHYLSVSKQFDQAVADHSSPAYLKELLTELEGILALLETENREKKMQLRFDL